MQHAQLKFQNMNKIHKHKNRKCLHRSKRTILFKYQSIKLATKENKPPRIEQEDNLMP